MKRIILPTILFALFVGCKEEEPKNSPPTCTITSPVYDSDFTIGEIVIISVDANDSDGTITEVRFYIDEIGVASLSSFPYTYEWNTSNEAIGNHKIKVTVKDDDNDIAETTIYISIIEDLSFVQDYDGNIYKTILIGDQLWMAENLRTTHLADGTEIQLIESNSLWSALDFQDQAMCYYENSQENATKYGALYTWEVAVNSSNGSSFNPSEVQGVCPDGWHLPSDEEWKELEMYLGMSETDANSYEYRGTNEGSKIAGSSVFWQNGILKSNYHFGTIGFNAIPAGSRGSSGSFTANGEYATFWTASNSYAQYAWCRKLNYNYSQIFRGGDIWHYGYKGNGFSVRCVKD
jgi:uncharacterized protein (TIGR02145 family)